MIWKASVARNGYMKMPIKDQGPLKSVMSIACLFLCIMSDLSAEFKEWSEFTAILKPSKIQNAGVGVFATHDIKKGTILFSSVNKMIIGLSDNVPEAFQKYIIDIDEEACWRPEKFDEMDISYYINHSLDANISLFNSRGHITLRDIYEGEEFLENYFESYGYSPCMMKYNPYLDEDYKIYSDFKDTCEMRIKIINLVFKFKW
jgi:hypothetical protein